MIKKFFCLLLSCAVGISAAPAAVFSSDEDDDGSTACYIATSSCPAAYTEYAEENISSFVLSMNDGLPYSSISVGTPFAFADAGADVYYYPVICDGDITYLFRVYPDGDSYSAAISEFLAEDINDLAPLTSPENPMYLNRVDTQLVATIGSEEYVLFEYPDYMSNDEAAPYQLSAESYSVVDAKSAIDIELNLRQTRDIYVYINLDLAETQSGNYWCTAYCLAAIIRKKTSYSVTAQTLMTKVYGSNPSTSAYFPWNKTSVVAKQYGLNPTVLITTASSGTLTDEIIAGRPCIMAMESNGFRHAVVLRGFSSIGTWGIWNPWYSFCENYSMQGTYVPYGYPSSMYSFTPYAHSYNFG